MRYSFHGKVRATGQQVDGFVEAANATQAIDRLADQGIIGVYTVRPDPKPPKNAVYFAGQEPPETEEAPQRPRLLEKPKKAYAPAPVPARPVALPAPAPVPLTAVVTPATDSVLAQLVDKITALTAQVEKMLARPAQVIYQSGGPARSGGGGGKKSRSTNEAQNSTLRDIFLNNMDLRKSLATLDNTVGPAAAPAIASSNKSDAGGTDAVATDPGSPDAGGGDAGLAEMASPDTGDAEIIDADASSIADATGPRATAEDDSSAADDSSSIDDSLSTHDAVHSGHDLIQSQPAA